MGTEQLGEATDGPQDGPEPRRLGRRALVGGALASGAGIAAVMVGAKKASATNGGSVILGQVNTASATTAVSTSVGNGLEGDTSGSGAAGVYGNDTSPTLGSAGVWGNSVHGYGVYGISQNYNAVYGSSSNAHSVFGEQTTDGYAGVYGDDESTGGGSGVYGFSLAGHGLVGEIHSGGLAQLRLVPGATAGPPTSGSHQAGEQYLDSNGALYSCTADGTPGTWVTDVVAGVDTGAATPTLIHYTGANTLPNDNLLTVYDAPGSDAGQSIYPSALAGWADGGTAGVKVGVYGYTRKSGGYGLVGLGSGDRTVHGVLAESVNGYGVEASGGAAPLHLVPADTEGAPAAGAHQLGEIYVDSAGTLYRCVVAGNPGTWVPMYSTVPLNSPVRVIDTRIGVGGIRGPLTPNQVYTTGVLTGGTTGIPASALALVGTASMLGPSPGHNLNGNCYLTLYPAGTSRPTTSNVLADTSYAIASGATVKVGSGANAGKMAIFASNTIQVLFDVAAYII